MSIAAWLFDHLFWLFLAIVLLNFLQRRYGSAAQKKRFATLYLAVAVFLIQLLAGLVDSQGLDQIWLIAGTAVVIGALVVFRDHTFPFRLRCAVSGERLDFDTILYKDSNTLPQYEEATEEPEEEAADEGEDEADDSADGASDSETNDIDERDEPLDDHDTPDKSQDRSSDGSDRDRRSS